MRIVDVRTRTVAVGGALRNAAIGFEGMTATALALVTDAPGPDGPLAGLALDSVGRYASGPVAEARFLPRLALLDPDTLADPARAQAALMRDEKPGGHGERAMAVGLVDAALWDLAAKRAGAPLWRLLAERFGPGNGRARVPVYASGGHYRGPDDRDALRAEILSAREAGHRAVKIKFGGAPRAADLRRLEAALDAADGLALAVDCCAVCGDDADALSRMLSDLASFPLAWIEEPVDPLDLRLHAAAAAASPWPLATGENLFSAAETANLLRHGGLRRDRDMLQMDVAFCYGPSGYLAVLAAIEAEGWSRAQVWPHAGHLLSLHAVAGFGLGGWEVASDPCSPFGSGGSGLAVEEGTVSAPEIPGVGFEAHPVLGPLFRDLLG